MRCSCVKQTFVPRCDLLFSSNRRFFLLCWNNVSNIWYEFCMHFVCISYAFYMHFWKMHAFLAKRHALLSKTHAFVKMYIKRIWNAYKMHMKCIQNAYEFPMNFQTICICFIKTNTQFCFFPIFTFLYWICFPG